MTTCRGSRTSQRSSAALPTRLNRRRCAAFGCIWRRAARARQKINATVSALRFFFNVTLDRPDLAKHLSFMRDPRKVPVVLSPEEVARFLEAAPSIKYKAALSVAYGAGLRVSEVVSLKVSDIDSERMMLRVEQGKGHKDRHAMLSPPAARTSARLVSHCAAAGLAIPGPESCQPDDDAPTHARLPRRSPHGRDYQACDATHITSLCSLPDYVACLWQARQFRP
jgi:integrase